MEIKFIMNETNSNFIHRINLDITPVEYMIIGQALYDYQNIAWNELDKDMALRMFNEMKDAVNEGEEDEHD